MVLYDDWEPLKSVQFHGVYELYSFPGEDLMS